MERYSSKIDVSWLGNILEQYQKSWRDIFIEYRQQWQRLRTGTGTGRSNYRNLALRDVVILMVSGTSRCDATDIILLR